MNPDKDRLYNCMENRLNREGIKKYSERFTRTIAKAYFKDKQRISGQEILELEPIRQINLFVIKNLFKEWQKETGKLKSQYFDYQNAEVNAALKEFMNILSRHISIDKKDFIPLYQSATEETVLLIFSPYDFYTHILKRNDDSMDMEDLKRVLKYVKVNRHLWQALIEKVEEQNIVSIDQNNLPQLLDNVFASIDDTPEDIEEYLREFTAVVPLTENDIYTEDSGISQTSTASDSVDSRTPLTDVDTVTWEVENTSKTLHDELAVKQSTTIADIHAKRKISNINENITLNQRFMFINTLFNGDDSLFSEVLNVLERKQSYQEAIQFLGDEFPHWDMEAEEVQEFIEIIGKRY